MGICGRVIVFLLPTTLANYSNGRSSLPKAKRTKLRVRGYFDHDANASANRIPMGSFNVILLSRAKNSCANIDGPLRIACKRD